MLPAVRRIRLFQVTAVAVSMLAAVLSVYGIRDASGAPPTVTWGKDPPSISSVLTDPLQTFTFNEVMSNQSDPAGLGGFTFTVVYDRNIWQPPSIDTSPASALFAGAGRTLSCLPGRSSPSTIETVCASTGTFGSGPLWTGPKTLAAVRFQLLPSVAAAIIGTNGGIVTNIYDVSVQVTNTCGQPLNDGTMVPLPGQHECQGNLLPGLGPGGVILNPGSTVVTLTTPATPTPTATATFTSTSTPTPTATWTATPSPTATATERPTRTATATQTALTPTAGAGTPTVAATSVATGTPGVGTSPTASVTGAATRTSTAVPTVTSTPTACGRDDAFWRTHPDRWPVASLQLGTAVYSRDELALILGTTSTSDASLVLARHLIAGKFNLASGGTAQLAQITAQGDRLMRDGGGRVPMSIDASSYTGQGMLWTAAWLSAVNCALVPSSASGAPTAVSTVLGITRPRPGPNAFPVTGAESPTDKSSAYRTVIVALCLVIVILAAGLARLVLIDRWGHER